MWVFRFQGFFFPALQKEALKKDDSVCYFIFVVIAFLLLERMSERESGEGREGGMGERAFHEEKKVVGDSRI